MKRGAPAAKNLLLALASTLLTLVLLALGYEAWRGVRYRAWRARYTSKGWLGTLTVPSPNPVLMWEYRPYGRKGLIRTNRHGFRDVDYPTPGKPAGVRRVAFIGDSVTLGLGVEEDRTFVRLCERKAQALAPGQPVQALNFGVDGYQTTQIAELLRARVVAFEPDLVVYLMCLNDFDRTDSAAEKILYFQRPRSFLWQDVSRLARRLRGGEFHRYHFERNRATAFADILDMQGGLAARQARFLLVVLPVFFEERRDFSGYPLRDVHEEIGAFCARHGIDVVDLLDALTRAEPPAERYALDPWHLSEEGHALVASELASHLLSAGPAPR